MAVLFPRFVDIRRGQVLCALVGGWALCPWLILASAEGFLSFMNAYSIFLGPFAGVIAVDYYLVRAGRVDVPALYRPRGRYRYAAGVNWRAALALLVSVPPNLPGLVRAISPGVRIGGAQDVFDFAWIFGVRPPARVFRLGQALTRRAVRRRVGCLLRRVGARAPAGDVHHTCGDGGGGARHRRARRAGGQRRAQAGRKGRGGRRGPGGVGCTSLARGVGPRLIVTLVCSV
jgi:hypothetical protein